MAIDPSGWMKLAVVVLVVVCTAGLGWAGKIEGQAVVGIFCAALGYVFGNAHGVISSAEAVTKMAEKLP